MIGTREHMNNWKHKDIWKKHGTDFLVEVSRHSEPGSKINDREGPHRWCVYAYIYPKHPHFAKFSGNNLWQDATSELPGHNYCSYLKYYRGDDGSITSIQVGWDYHHDGDYIFTHDACQEDAQRQFSDAQELFDRLQALVNRTEQVAV